MTSNPRGPHQTQKDQGVLAIPAWTNGDSGAKQTHLAANFDMKGIFEEFDSLE